MSKHILTIVISVVAGLLLFSMLIKRTVTSPYKVSVAQQAALVSSAEASFSLLELSQAVQSNNPNIMFIDLRSEEEYAQGYLPNAINVPMGKLFHSTHAEYIEGRSDKVKVLYANDESTAARALSLLAMRGYTNYKVLNGGYIMALKTVISGKIPSLFHHADEQMRYNYKRLMPAGVQTTQVSTPMVEEQPAAPRGGC